MLGFAICWKPFSEEHGMSSYCLDLEKSFLKKKKKEDKKGFFSS